MLSSPPGGTSAPSGNRPPRGLGRAQRRWAAIGSFFGGMLLIAVIDRYIPAQENPHEAKPLEAEAPLPTPLLRLGGMIRPWPLPSQFPGGGWPPSSPPSRTPPSPGPSWWPLPFTTFRGDRRLSPPLPGHWLPAGRPCVWSFLSGLAERWEPSWAVLLAPVMSSTLFGCSMLVWRGSWCSSPWTSFSPAAGPMGAPPGHYGPHRRYGRDGREPLLFE